MRARSLLVCSAFVSCATSSACAMGTIDGEPPLDSAVSCNAPDAPAAFDTGPDDAAFVRESEPDTSRRSSDADDETTHDSAFDAFDVPEEHDARSDVYADSPLDALVGCTAVVNEVQTGGTTAADEFVEIENPCHESLDLGGYALGYRSRTNVAPASGADFSIVYAFPTSTSLASRSWFVVAGIDFAGPKDALESAPTSKGMLSAIGGQLALRNPSGAVVDAVFYGTPPSSGIPAFLEGTPASAPTRGASIYRHPDGVDSEDNGADFADVVTTPTPGAENP